MISKESDLAQGRGPLHLAVSVALGLMSTALPALAQQVPAPAGGSLVVDPQQGATPQLLQPSPSLPPAPVERPVIVQSTPDLVVATPPLTLPQRSSMPYGPISTPRQPPWSKEIAGGLPVPSGDPLRIDPKTDPILQLARTQSSMLAFSKAIGAAVAQNPALDEAVAQADEADAARAEAVARRFPTADLSVSSFRVIDRAFSNDPNNVLERSRPSHRTDGQFRVQQSLIDFGAGLNRVRAGQARLDAARARVEDTGTQIALRAISAWYTVFGYRVLVRLSNAFTVSQRGMRENIEDRIRQGAAAAGDIAQVDGYIAASDARKADFQRQLANAEAQYAAIIGSAPPAGLARAPLPSLNGIGISNLPGDTDKLPIVQAARLSASAARSDVRALKSARLPQLSGGIDAGRYGIIETERDYDIRGSVTLSMRLGGGAAQRVHQAEARADGADARLRRTKIEAQRDAEIALSDVNALEEAQAAIESNYIASRQSRDVLAERFRVARGSLFDLLNADNNYFGVAARYIQTVIELDTARYALLARTGKLLTALDIPTTALEPR